MNKIWFAVIGLMILSSALVLAGGTPKEPMKDAEKIGRMAWEENNFLKTFGVNQYDILCDEKTCWASISTSTKAITESKGLATTTSLRASKTLTNYYFSRVSKIDGLGRTKPASQIRTEIFVGVKKNIGKVLQVNTSKAPITGNTKINTKQLMVVK